MSGGRRRSQASFFPGLPRRRGRVGAAGVNTAGAPLARPPHPMRAPQSPPEPAGLQNLLPSKQCVSHRLISLIVFQNGHISGALAELIRSTRAPIKDRLIGKIMAGIRCFAARACRSTGSPSWCPRACARALPEGKCSGRGRD
jgi:hypothetical protein